MGWGLGGTVGEVHLDPDPLEQQLNGDTRQKVLELKRLLSTAGRKKNIQWFKDHQEFFLTQQDCKL